MKKLTLAAALLASTAFMAPASADVVLDTKGLGGTGDNVVFSSFNGPLGLVLGRLNGQHDEVVRFRDLSGNVNFDGFANTSGNDIKITNTSNLDIQVFDSTDVTMVGTVRDIFSLTGSGNVTITVTLLEADGSTNVVTLTNHENGGTLLALDATKPLGVDLKAINGEIITDIDLKLSLGGSITDFEHYRIDATPLAVPGPVVATGIPGLIAACFGLFGMNWHRRRRNGANFKAS